MKIIKPNRRTAMTIKSTLMMTNHLTDSRPDRARKDACPGRIPKYPEQTNPVHPADGSVRRTRDPRSREKKFSGRETDGRQPRLRHLPPREPAPAAKRLLAGAQTAECFFIRPCKRKGCIFRKIEFGGRRRKPLRPCDCVLNRETHIRYAELCDHGVVFILDQRMHDTFPLNQHVDAVFRHPKQPGSLDDFKSLVHHCGGVNRHLGAHVPIRVPKGLLRCDTAQFFFRFSEERPPEAVRIILRSASFSGHPCKH